MAETVMRPVLVSKDVLISDFAEDIKFGEMWEIAGGDGFAKGDLIITEGNKSTAYVRRWRLNNADMGQIWRGID